MNGLKLINGFKTKTKKTIWKHLNTLACREDVYSAYRSRIFPHLNENQVYIYAAPTGLVVLCFDHGPATDELVDEDPFNDEKPLYFTAVSHRVSPVWQLSETLKLIRKKLEEGNNHWDIHGVLLTDSRFLNADCMRERWEEMNVTVIDELSSLRRKSLPVSADEELVFGTMIMEFIDELSKEHEPTDLEEDEFQRMMEDFIMSNDSEGMKNEESDDDEELDDDDDEDDEEEEDEDEIDDSRDDSVDDAPSPFFPSGSIEQNPAISVNVQVLRPLKNPREELDKLVGCQDIKRRLDELLALTRYNKMVREAFPDAKLHEVSLHSIFYGRPGTGKTTVCKIFGSLLREVGALSKGHVLVANRGTFLGTLWGDEERSVRQVLEQAQGGVLMIDEAYLLNSKNEHDPGRMVIQLLMEVLADETQRDIAVVLCGYKEPMLKLLDSNPGLQSRFPNRFEFDDFTVDELLEIAHRRVGEYQYRFTDSAWQKLREVLTSAYSVRDPQSWGNARFVANQLERIYLQHAQRCVRECPSDKEQLLWLTPADITPIEVARARPRIGF